MLAPGSKLGTYEVLEPLGAGGMGEVYRARDSRLGRDVALKVLPEHVGRDAQRLARFEREARVLASLNHPNIATLYGIDESTSTPALVLEFVEGQTLADRLGEGAVAPLSIEQAIAIARQIVAALEAAHERGIIHRDLKPSNVALRQDGTVKVLDFGLAKALELERSAGPDSATITNIERGTVLGTPAYMSPEQARGLPVDKRADIWAFGCVLYEMLTGHRAFEGERTSEVVAKVIEREPDLDSMPQGTPPAVCKLLRKCLEKDPRHRLRDIGDALFDLEDEGSPLAAAPVPERSFLLPGIAVAGALALTAMAVWWSRPEEVRAAPILFSMSAPAQHVLVGTPVPSPDGSRLVFVATSTKGESGLWLRALDSPVARPIAGTEGAIRPFWSPDGRFVGFATAESLKRVGLNGAPVQVIALLAVPFAGATWNEDGVIVFAPANRSPLHRVSAAGGVTQPVTALNAARGENSHRYPHFLPGGRHFLFTARAALRENTGIHVASIGSGQTKWLLAAQSPAIYVPPGSLLFVRDGALYAQGFNAETLELSGVAEAIYDDIPHQTQGASAEFAASSDGRVLAWGARLARELAWFDRGGAKLGVVGGNGNYEQLRISPDGKHAAVVVPDDDSGNRDIWVIELATGASTRLTSHPANDWFPVWSPDSAALLFASERNDEPGFYRTTLDDTRRDELVFRADPTRLHDVYPTDWSRDGRQVVFHSFPQTRERGGGIWMIPMLGNPMPAEVVQTPFTDWVASFSPDGKWLAYMSNESGIEDVYVKSLKTARRHRVSASGGSQPRWRHDGRELFFLSPGNQLMSVAVAPGNEFVSSPPKLLFAACGPTSVAWEYRYDVMADGERILWLCPANDAASAATVVVNWAVQRDDRH